MKNSKFSEVQIIKILAEQNQGKTVNEICREHGNSQPTFYKWKSKYGGLDVQQIAKNERTAKRYPSSWGSRLIRSGISSAKQREIKSAEPSCRRVLFWRHAVHGNI